MTTTDKIILPDSPEAATFRTSIKGWVSRDGKFYGDGKTAEEIARWAGCTHVPCGQCGTPTPKGRTRCDACRRQAEIERYEAMPRAEWDGEAMIYSEERGLFYFSPEDAIDDSQHWQTPESLRLVICEPVRVRRLDIADVLDGLGPDDAEIPRDVAAAIQAAVDAYNAAVSGFVLSWEPGKTALAMTEDGP